MSTACAGDDSTLGHRLRRRDDGAREGASSWPTSFPLRTIARCYHHFCLTVSSVDETVRQLRARGETIVTEPFVLPVISRRLGIICDPFGNLIELAEVLG